MNSILSLWLPFLGPYWSPELATGDPELATGTPELATGSGEGGMHDLRRLLTKVAQEFARHAREFARQCGVKTCGSDATLTRAPGARMTGVQQTPSNNKKQKMLHVGP